MLTVFSAFEFFPCLPRQRAEGAIWTARTLGTEVPKPSVLVPPDWVVTVTPDGEIDVTFMPFGSSLPRLT